jgi:hypothetical protein
MAYSEFQIERIEKCLKSRKKKFEGKPFMGGYCIFIDEKMAIGLDVDKKTGRDRLMVRIGESAMAEAMANVDCTPMDITGKPLKGFVFVDDVGFDEDVDLEYWINLALAFNPLAKKHKKKH